MLIMNGTPTCCARQISSLAPDAVDCCSLARKLGLRLTDGLPDDPTSMVDDAEEACAQATAGVGGGAGGDDVMLLSFGVIRNTCGRPDRTVTPKPAQIADCQTHRLVQKHSLDMFVAPQMPVARAPLSTRPIADRGDVEHRWNACLNSVSRPGCRIFVYPCGFG